MFPADTNLQSLAAEAGNSFDALPSWEFARLHTNFRRNPPHPDQVIGRSLTAKGRPQADLDLCRRLLTKMTTVVRDDRIKSIRQTIAYDQYENALKVEVATDRLLDDLDGRPWRV